MSDILRRTAVLLTPAAPLGVEHYIRSFVSAAMTGQRLADEARTDVVSVLTHRTNASEPTPAGAALTLSTTHVRHNTAQPLHVRCLHSTGGSVVPGEAASRAAPATHHASPVACARQTFDSGQDALASHEARDTSGCTISGSTPRLPASQPTSATERASAPAPPSGGDAPGNTPAPSSSNAGPGAFPPEGAYALGTPESRDQFIRIAGGPRTGPATLCYQTFGHRDHPPLVLLAGLGHSCLYWRDAFCEACAEAGFFVIRLDNRDAGLSSHVDAWSPPPIWHAFMPTWLSPSGQVTPPYQLSHLADDVLQCLDALGLSRAHVVGSSMGGMIAQEVALTAPERVLSLTLFFTSAGGKPVIPPPLRTRLGVLDRPRSSDLPALIDFKVRLDARSAGRLPFDEAASRAYWERALRRSPNDVAAFQRQLWALVTSPSRAARLKVVSTSTRAFPPTTVIHGTADTSIPHGNGEHLAAHIHKSKLILWPDMGHAIPPSLDMTFVEQLKTHLET